MSSDPKPETRLVPVGSSSPVINGFRYEFLHVGEIENSAWKLMNKTEREFWMAETNRDIVQRAEEEAAERAYSAPERPAKKIENPLDTAVKRMT